MKKSDWYSILCVLIFFQYTYFVSGQGNVDSLRQILSNNPVDTAKVDVLNMLAAHFYNHSSDSARILSKQALSLARKVQYKKGIAYANHNIAVVFIYESELDSAAYYFERSLEVKREINDTKSIAGTLNNLGVIHRRRGDYRRALDYYQKSLKLKLEQKDSLNASNTLLNIGSIHNYQKNYDLALKYQMKALEIREKFSDYKKIASSLNSIGLILLAKKDYPTALTYFDDALQVLDTIPNNCLKLSAHINLGVCHKEMNQLNLGLQNLQLGHDFAIDCDDPYSISIALVEKGKIYQLLGQNKLAKNAMIESYEIAKKHSLKDEMRVASRALYELNKEMGQTAETLKYLEITTQLKDSLSNEDVTKQLTSMELNYQFEQERDSLEHQKETELLVLNTEVREQRLFKNIMIAGVFVLLLVIYLVFRNYKANKLANQYLRKKNELQEQQLEIEEKSRKQLELDNNQKARALTASSIEMLNLNEKMEALIDTINQNQNIDPFERKKIIKEIGRLKSVDSQWDSIKIHFENVHPYFFEKLDKYYPQLSMNDQKVLAFLKMKLSNKEIALILNVEKRTVEQSKRRLKKKLGMDIEDTDILGFIERGEGIGESVES